MTFASSFLFDLRALFAGVDESGLQFGPEQCRHLADELGLAFEKVSALEAHALAQGILGRGGFGDEPTDPAPACAPIPFRPRAAPETGGTVLAFPRRPVRPSDRLGLPPRGPVSLSGCFTLRDGGGR